VQDNARQEAAGRAVGAALACKPMPAAAVLFRWITIAGNSLLGAADAVTIFVRSQSLKYLPTDVSDHDKLNRSGLSDSFAIWVTIATRPLRTRAEIVSCVMRSVSSSVSAMPCETLANFCRAQNSSGVIRSSQHPSRPRGGEVLPQRAVNAFRALTLCGMPRRNRQGKAQRMS
jgi:hypothetical protein